MNNKGVKFIHERSKPLNVTNIGDAAEAMASRIIGNELHFDDEAAKISFCRHLAWIIGFDDLTDDRQAVHALVDKIVE